MTDAQLAPHGRVILISGANRGIGRAVAERLHADGYSLSLGARQVQSLDPLASVMASERVATHAFEAKDRDSAARWIAGTMGRFGRIDGVVANAGILHDFTVEEENEALLDEMWEVNVKGPLRLIRAAMPALKASGRGRVVNIVSLSGKRVKSASIAGYAMTKHAAAALTHGARYAGWDHGVRATSICPGYVATDMTADVGDFDQAAMIRPETIADLAALALSLPNTASVSEIPVNCVLEGML